MITRSLNRTDYRKRPRPGVHGFSLIEVMISIAILAAGLLALMSMQTGALRANYNNQNLVVAQHVAEMSVEWVKTLAVRDLDSDGVGEIASADVMPVLGVKSIGGLGSEYQFSGLSKAAKKAVINLWKPDYVRYVGTTVNRAQDPNRSALARRYVVRLAVENDYRNMLTRCSATIFWEQNGEVVSFETVFLVDREELRA